MIFEEYFEKFEKLQRWTITDLRNASVKAHANFLVAQGIFNSIEILGGFYIPENKKGVSTLRFEFAITELFPNKYQETFEELKRITNKGAYDCLRCGLTHEYLVKTYTLKDDGNHTDLNFSIYGIDDEAHFNQVIQKYDCGLVLYQLSKISLHLRIYNPRLIFDLDLAFEELKARILRDDGYQSNFVERCEGIGLHKFN